MEGLFVLISIYNYTFGLMFSFLTGEDDSLVLRILAVAILFYSIFKYQGSLKKPADMVIKTKFYKWLIFVLLILVGMFFTCYLNGGINGVARTYILSYGTRVIGAVLLAFVFVRKRMIAQINKWINVFADFYSIVLLVSVLMNSTGKLSDLEIGRQSLSYAGAFALIMHIYINSNYSSVGYFRLFKSYLNKLINYVLIAIDIFVIVAGGGKGAFLLAIIASLYFVYKNVRSLGLKGVLGVFVFVIAVSAIMVYSSSSNYTVSGYNAIKASFESGLTDMSSMQRRDLYQSAWRIAKESWFLGNGVASTAYNVGFYTHNIFLDVLVDFGIVGIVVLTVIVLKFLNCASRLMKKSIDTMPEFLFIVFISSFVMLLFSGSFYSEGGLWFSVVSMSIINKTNYLNEDVAGVKVE